MDYIKPKDRQGGAKARANKKGLSKKYKHSTRKRKPKLDEDAEHTKRIVIANVMANLPY